MNYKTFFIILLTPLLLVGCDFFEPKYPAATLYKYYVGEDNDVFTIVARKDTDAIFAMMHCEKIAKRWHLDDGITYVCSTKHFNKPRIDWNIVS
jgi:hypothetical protein